MNKDFIELKLKAKECLKQMSIIDGDAFINNLLFELAETDDSNIEIKKQTLEEIRNLLVLKNKFKIKNDDLFYLKNSAQKLRNNMQLNNNELENLLNIIKNNF